MNNTTFINGNIIICFNRFHSFVNKELNLFYIYLFGTIIYKSGTARRVYRLKQLSSAVRRRATATARWGFSLWLRFVRRSRSVHRCRRELCILSSTLVPAKRFLFCFYFLVAPRLRVQQLSRRRFRC